MARRVNTRFLIILTSVVVGGGAAAFTTATIVKKMRNNPEKFLNEGRAMMAAENWDEAVPLLSRAFQLSHRNPEIPVVIGTVYEQKALKERDPRESIQRSRAAFQAALEVDQGYMPALRKLLASYTAELVLDSRPQSLRNVIDIADKILAVTPDDHDAIVAKESATIRTWMSGVATDTSVIDASLANLQATLEKHAGDPKPLESITQVYLRRALDALRATQTEKERLAGARQQLEALAAIMEKALVGQESNPAMSLQAARGFLAIDELEADPNLSAQYDTRVKTLLAAAKKDLKPSDPSFVDVGLAWADQLRRDNDKAGVETMLKDLIAQVPHAYAPRRALFQLLVAEPARRNEAIKLALEPLPTAANATAFDVLIAKAVQDQMLLDATNARTEVYATSTDEGERAKLKADIDAAIASMSEKQGENPALLRVKGKFQLMQGQNVEAIGTLNKALNILNQASAQKDYDLIYQLGRAYVATKQTGQAKSMFLLIIERVPNFVPARAQLAQLYLGDNQASEAILQLDALEKLSPNSVDVMRMRFQAYMIQGKRNEAMALFAKLPQETKLDRLAKAQFALQLNDRPGAIVILEEAAKAFPT
jgi:tetratricopeptide (TPR) repeat protein